MLERIIRAAASQPLVPLALALGAAGLGIVAASELPRDVFPDLSAPVFNVIVQNPAMGAEELETSIAIPLETALSGLPGVRRVRSTNQLGVTQVTVEFDPDADWFRSRQYVAEHVAQVAPSLPPGTESPLLSGLTGRLNEIMELTLEAESGAADLMTLRDLAEFDLRRRLLAVPGVAAVEVLGGYLRQFQVLLDPDRMSARSITLNDVRHAVEGASRNGSGGFLVEGPMEWSVRALGRASTVAELREVVVAVRGPTPVLLGDVADVREAPAVRRGIAHRLSGEVVSCRVVKQFGADTVAVSAGVRAALDALRGVLPRGVHLAVAYDQADLVDEALSGVGRAVLLGAFFVVFVLLSLLGNVRATLLVTLTIPLSLAIAALLLGWADVGLNTMTLGGLAIAVGLLVDASIIVVENVLHRLGQHRAASSRHEVAVLAAAEVGRPIVFATLIVVAVFLPLFSMTGIEGRMYQPLAGAVVASMMAALALALTVTPTASALLLRPPRQADGDVWLVRRLKRLYAPLLDFSLRHAGIVCIVAFGLTGPALWLAMRVGSDFVPPFDEGALLIQTIVPAEASLDEVDLLNHRVEDEIRKFPEVEDVVRRTGRSERTEDPMPHTVSDVLVVLRADRARSGEVLEEAIRQKLARVPGVTSLFTTPLGMRIDEGLGGTPADITVRVFGPELPVLSGLADQAREIVQEIRGIEDLRVEQLTGLPQVHVVVDRGNAARVGLTPGDVVAAVGTGLVGEELGEIWVGTRRYDLMLRLQDHRRGDITALRTLLLDGHDGTRVPLGQVARVERAVGPGSIRREAGSRRIAIEASVAGRDLGSTAAEVRQRLRADLQLPTGYFFDLGGRVESQARASSALGAAIVVALVAVFLLLYLALGSVSDTLVILAMLPDAFVGGIVALWLTGGTWNVSSLVGLIGLFGIAVQNGLVLVTQARGLMAEGRSLPEAIREASIGRMRPKLLTASCAILGLLPLLLLPFRGTEIERPLAVVMLGGLVTSTIFTLFALPTFYLFVHRLRERLARRGPELRTTEHGS